MGFYSPATLIHDAKRHGVEVRPPCLAMGDWECTTEPPERPQPRSSRAAGIVPPVPHPALRVGWRFVTGIGAKAIEALRAARQERPFTSIADVAARTTLPRAELTELARAGAFAAWEPDRRKAAWEALRAGNDRLPLAPAHRTEHRVAPLTRNEMIHLDYAATGVSIHGHPMATYRDALRERGAKDSRQIVPMRHRQPVVVAGLVVIRQRPHTANGTLFLLLEDEHGFVNVIVRKPDVELHEEVVKRAQYILVRGEISREGDAISVLGRDFEALELQPLAQRSRDFR
jgi:error-prone DNA polymerase